MPDDEILRKAIRAVEGEDKLKELKKYMRENHGYNKGGPYDNTIEYLDALKKQYDRIKWEKDNKQEYKAVKNTIKEKVKTERILPMATYKAYDDDDILTYTNKTKIHQDLHKAMISSGKRKKEQIEAEIDRRWEQIVKDVERECETLLLTLTLGTMPRHFSVRNHQYIFQVSEGFINKRDIPKYAEEFALDRVSALGESLWKKYTEEEYAEYVRTCRGFTREYIKAYEDEYNKLVPKTPDDPDREEKFEPPSESSNKSSDISARSKSPSVLPDTQAPSESDDFDSTVFISNGVRTALNDSYQKDRRNIGRTEHETLKQLNKFSIDIQRIKNFRKETTMILSELSNLEAEIFKNISFTQKDNETVLDTLKSVRDKALKDYDREKKNIMERFAALHKDMLHLLAGLDNPDKAFKDYILNNFNRTVGFKKFILDDYNKTSSAGAEISGQSQYLEYDSEDLEELMGITFSDTE